MKSKITNLSVDKYYFRDEMKRVLSTVFVKRTSRKKPRGYYSTPASLRRVCRLLQGQPPFGEPEQVCDQQEKPALSGVCEWRGRVTALMQYVFDADCGAGAYHLGPGDYCSFCGRKRKVIE